jgi:predicted amidohydrolase
MKIHCVQLDIAWENKEANHERVKQLLAAHPPEPGSLVVLPEMFSTGFSMNVADISESARRKTEKFLADLARKLGVFIMGGVVTTDDAGGGNNQSLTFAPSGEEIARYTKLQPFTHGGEAEHYNAGQTTVVFKWQDLIVSPFICYDLRFPEHFREAVTGGAQLFVVIANWPMGRILHWETLLRARAIENQAYVAGVNRTGADPKITYNGGSLIANPKGELLAHADDRECVISAELLSEELLAYRKDFPFLADRRG